MKKIRADELLYQRGFVDTRSRAKTLIMMGKVYADNEKIEKAGDLLYPDCKLEIKEDLPYVSRGGLKLESAIKSFNIDVRDKIALDVGASTGGFTDCLLKFGAKKVYAVDVGYGLLDDKLRKDQRVVNIERVNFRYIDPNWIPEKVDIVTVDVSFISLTLIIPKALLFLKDNGDMVCLIKPQFELMPKEIGSGGIVREEAFRQKAVKKIVDFSKTLNMKVVDVIPSPILGQKGNKEYLIYLHHR